jgi:hypothetical protein
MRLIPLFVACLLSACATAASLAGSGASPAPAALPEPAPEEYAVFRLALDTLYARSQPQGIVVIDSVAPIDVAEVSGWYSQSSEMTASDPPVIAPTGSVHLVPARLGSRVRVTALTDAGYHQLMTPRSDGPADRTPLERRYGGGVMVVTLGRPMFNRAHTRALVAAFGSCGPRCGSGAALVLAREGDHWVVRTPLFQRVS